MRATCNLLADHWDRAAADSPQTGAGSPALNRFWQAIPSWFEEAAAVSEKDPVKPPAWAPQAAELQARLEEANAALAASRAETAAKEARIADLLSSLSWKVTAPLRLAGRPLRKPKPQMMDLGLIRHHRLETRPYRWALISSLFNPQNARRLVATYPCDHFKVVASYGGSGPTSKKHAR